MDGFLPLALATIGIGFVLYCRRMAGKAERSELWPPTSGWVTRSEVVTDTSLVGTAARRVYKSAIEYTYTVGSQEHRSDTICIGGTFDTSLRGRAEKRCSRYPVGASVNVFYDPSNPDTACLEKSAEGTLLFTWVGVGLIALAVLVYLDVIRFR